MPVNSALGDSYYRVYKALHLVTSEAIPCVDNALRVWHTVKQKTLPQCTGSCPDGKKPKGPASCKNCINWGSAVEGVYYQPTTTSPPQPTAIHTTQKAQITWSNVSQSHLGKSHVELAKAFILRLPNKPPTVTSGGAAQLLSSVSDFDCASLLMIMTRFREFHQGDQASCGIINKITQIRNNLSHMGLKDDMRLEDSKVDEYFRDIVAFVSCLETLHPQHFASGNNVRSRLNEIQMEPVTAKMKEDIHLNVSLELQSVSQEVADLKQLLRKRTLTCAYPGDLSHCRNQLKANYLTKRGGIGFMPGMPQEFSLDEYFVDLSLVREKQRPTHVQVKPLKGYTDVLTLKDQQGRRLDHVLVRGEAGTGKSTMVNKLAYQWALDLEPSADVVSDDTRYPLRRFQLVFALDIRKFKPDMDLEDCIHVQLLPDIPKEVIKLMLIANADKCLFLLDGFDELRSQQQVLSSSRLLCGCVIVTTRPDTVEEFCRDHYGYVHVRLDGFSITGRETFVNKFMYTASNAIVEQHKITDRTETLIEKLKTSYLNALACYPLLLAMLCVIWDQTGEIPLRMTALYKQAVDMFALQFYTRTCFTKSLSSQQNREVTEVLLHLGSTALDGLLLNDKQLIFERDAFKRPSRIQFTSNHLGVAFSCGCLFACIGLEVGLRIESLRLGLALALFGLSLGFSLFSFKINRVVDVIGHALKLGLLLKVKGTGVVIQYSFYHKTFQEFCAAKYWVYLIEFDRVKFESYLRHIKKANVDNMQYLLRFCCGFSRDAAAIILQHIVSHCDLDWRLPVTLLFEAESDSHIHLNLHNILRPIRRLELGHDTSPELWSVLNHYMCGQGKQTWLTHIEKVNVANCGHDFLINATESSSFNKSLNSVSLSFESPSKCPPPSTLVQFLGQQLQLTCLQYLATNPETVSVMDDVLLELLRKPTRTNAMCYFDIVIPNMTTLCLGYIGRATCERILDIIIAEGKKLSIQSRSCKHTHGTVCEPNCLPMQKLIFNDNFLIDGRENSQESRTIDKFVEALSYLSGLEILQLSDVSLTKHSLSAIGPAISKLSNLQVLDLSSLYHLDMKSKHYFFQAGHELSRSLRCLKHQQYRNLLNADGLDRELHTLLPLECVPQLRELRLLLEDTGIQGANILSTSLYHVPLLTHLDIALVDDESVIALSWGLRHTPKLTKLFIWSFNGRSISVEATESIFKTLIHLPNLKDLFIPDVDIQYDADINSSIVKAYVKDMKAGPYLEGDEIQELVKVVKMFIPK